VKLPLSKAEVLARIERLSPGAMKKYVATRRVLAAWKHVLGSRRSDRRNGVRMLRTGIDALGSMAHLIESAKRSIHVEMYMIGDDAVGRGMIERLTAAANRGVEVRLIYDAVGSLDVGHRFFAALRAAGGEVIVFHAPHLFSGAWELVRRNHRKLISVDGGIAIVGGINWTSDFLPVQMEGGAGWYDLAVEIAGPAVGDIEVFFWRTWIYCGGEVPDDVERLFAKPVRRGRARVFARATTRIFGRYSVHHALRGAVMASQNSVRFLQSYFVPPGTFVNLLREASARGVSVQVIMPQDSDVPIAQAAGRALYARLMEAGVQLYERPGSMMHAKVVVIDRWRSFIGSSNLNHRSIRLNLELSVEIRSRSFARALLREHRAVRRASVQVTREYMRSWTLMRRMYHEFCYLFRFWI
jgi:cardiolipin synthase